jgi:glycine dehydrogenase subunit 1
MYDGASALAEALLMAVRITRMKRVAISALIHPHYRHVVRTYLGPTGYDVIELPGLDNGRTDLSPLGGLNGLAAVAVQSPNFFGCVEDLEVLEHKVHRKKALFITSFTEPLAYGLFKSPGSLGADIACGEGQSLGIPQLFGGPGLGMFGTKRSYVRSMPGRLVGQTIDAEGRRGFVLTLATREQHIRREKANSNICTNNSLCAIAAAMYLSSLGRTGFQKLARLNYDKAEYLKAALGSAGFRIPYDSPSFNEFVVEFPDGFGSTYQRLLQRRIVTGLPLAPYYPGMKNHYVICVTETKTKKDLDDLVKEVQS